MPLPYGLVRPLLFALPPERAHGFGLWSAKIGGGWLGALVGSGAPDGQSLEVAGLKFKNPLGLAAGFDKNGVALPFWRAIGFGYFEFGTVTPRPQPGNPAPRLWRFRKEHALGNKLGFPNEGAAVVAARLARDKKPGDVIGINLGKNKDTPHEKAAADYVAALEATRSVADYWAVNVSSPNTPGLRDLQTPQYLSDLLGAVCDAAGDVPVFVKLSPDLDEDALRATAGAVSASNCRGVIATNTTLERPAGIGAFEGGLSGRPLAARARSVLADLRSHLDPGQTLIAAGGIDSGAEARTRLDAGAALLQIYSALIFAGPALVGTMLSELGNRP